jgi:WD40-like Beta Propeller Repeat
MSLLKRYVVSVGFASFCTASCLAMSTQDAVGAASSLPSPQIFAPGEISGPANDGAPTFSPDGSTLFFTRTAANWTVIVESHKVNGHWSRPVIAPFSGEWPDSSPGMAPDGSYIVFQSTRPKVPLTSAPKAGEPVAGRVSNLWRVDRVGDGWSEPKRLPDAVNINGLSIWKPSVAADGTVYLTAIDAKGSKRLYASQYKDGAYQEAQPLAFSDGTTMDVDPEIAPDGSFLVFVSAGRWPGMQKDHLFIVLKKGDGWGAVTPIRYAGDDKPSFSTDDEPRLGSDHRTLYFSSDRVVPVHFPRTKEQAQIDLERMDLWDNSNSNVWFIPLASWLNPDDAGKM